MNHQPSFSVSVKPQTLCEQLRLVISEKKPNYSVAMNNTDHHSWRKDDKPGRQAILLLLLVSEKQKQKNLNLLRSRFRAVQLNLILVNPWQLIGSDTGS